MKRRLHHVIDLLGLEGRGVLGSCFVHRRNGRLKLIIRDFTVRPPRPQLIKLADSTLEREPCLLPGIGFFRIELLIRHFEPPVVISRSARLR